MLSFDRLRAFVVFSEHMSLTRAARALHISQPALHAQLSKLSDELGVPLYQRRGRQLALTPQGVRALALAREMMERGAELLRELGGDLPLQPVVLAAGAGSYLHVLGPSIRAFVKGGRGSLRLLTEARDGALAAVHSGRAHVAVTVGELPTHELVARPLLTVPQVLVMPRGHPLTRRSVRLSDLRGAALVVPPPESEHRRHVADALRDEGVSWQVAVEASGWDVMLHFVSLGLGLAIVNGCCSVPRGLVARPIPALPKRTYWLLHRRGLRDGSDAAALVAAIASHAGDASRHGGRLA